MGTINFNGIHYPYIVIKMPFGERIISVESLNEKLMTSEGTYVSENARLIDEKIFYFVTENSLSLEHDSLLNLIQSEL